MTAGKRQGVTRQQFLAFEQCRGGGTKARDRVEDRRLAARARYPAPAVGLPPWYRFATNGLLLRYIAGGGERYTQLESRRFQGFFVGFNRQYVRSAHYGEVCDFFGPYPDPTFNEPDDVL